MTIQQLIAKLKAAQEQIERKDQVLLEVLNFLTLRQISQGLAEKIRGVLGGGK